MPAVPRRPVAADLPPDLVSRPRRTDDLRVAGVTDRELRGPLWQPVHRGVHVWLPDPAAALDATGRLEPLTRILAARELMPTDAALGGWAALYLQGVTDIDGKAGAGARMERPVQVCVGRSGRIRPRVGVLVDRSGLSGDDVTEISGLLVTTPQRSCIDIARRYGLEEGVVAADAACRFGRLTPEALRQRVDDLGRVPGLPRIRRMAELVSSRSASCPESVLRVVWTEDAGLPKPLVNAEVRSELGELLGVADLLDPDAAMAGEYDGKDHRDLLRHTADNNREEGFERRNLVVVRATSVDLWPRRAQLVSRLRAGHADGIGRDRSRDRWYYRPPAVA